jgi:glycosyltransferase involved in cell wall biosynthesis
MVRTRHRILVVAKNLQQGGTERQVLRMLGALDRDRFEVALCTLSPECHYEDLPAGEPRYSFAAREKDAPTLIAASIDDFRPDVVHSFRDVVNRQVYEALARSKHQPSWLASVRGRPILPVDLLGTFRFFRRTYRITVNSIGIRQTLRRFAGVPATKIVVMPNLIDETVSSPASPRERRQARESLGLSDDAFVWVLPGRLSWVKNQIGLVGALALLKLFRALPHDATVVLAGRVRDGAAARLMWRLARLFRVSKHLRYVGSLKTVSHLYAAADALVLPSWAEGMPNVVLEAQLGSLPVVVTHQANRDGLVRHGDSGLVVTTGSPFALARALARLMKLPEILRRRMGQRGRASLLESHAPGPLIARLERLYANASLAGRALIEPPRPRLHADFHDDGGPWSSESRAPKSG